MHIVLACILTLFMLSGLSYAGTVTMVPGDNWQTKLAQLDRGDTLQLADGTYSPVTFSCGGSIKQGLPSAPITITALHERQAKVLTSGSVPAMYVIDCQYWNIVGLTLQSGDAPATTFLGGSLLAFAANNNNNPSHHIQVRRNLLFHVSHASGSPDDTFGIGMLGGQNNFLFEENELYDVVGQSAWMLSTNGGSQGDHIIRRNYIHNRISSGAYSQNAEIACYFCQGTVIMENNIAENAGGFGGYGGSDVRYYGNIVNNIRGTTLFPYLPYLIKSGAHNNNGYGKLSFSLISKDNLGIQTFLGPGADSTLNVNITHNTSIRHILYQGNVNNDAGVSNSVDTRQGGQACYRVINNVAVPEHCNSQYDMTVVFKDSLILNSAGGGIGFFDVNLYTGTPGGLTLTNMNVFGSANGNYNEATGGAGGTKYSQDPTMGNCTAWIPDGTFNKGKASDGGDIGATILYAYNNGALTNTPLWNSDGSWIGCGALVTGINDDPATSCRGVGTRLNINQNGCPFPAGYASGAGTVARAHWTLDEGADTILHDSSGNSNHLALASPVWIPGHIGPFALSFAGAVGGATRPAFTNTVFSWAAWVKGTGAPAQSTAGSEPLSNGNAATENWGFGWDNIGTTFRQACFVLGGNGNYYAAKIPTPLAGGVWYHLGSTFDGTTLKCYLNGSPVISVGGIPGGMIPSGQFHLGAAEAAGFSGAIDDVYIENRALTDAEMLALAAGGQSIPRLRVLMVQ